VKEDNIISWSSSGGEHSTPVRWCQSLVHFIFPLSQEWKAEQEAEMKAKMAESSRYKSYRRYMKNNRTQMTFGPD